MRRFVLILLMLGASAICKAQFHYGYEYTPYDYAKANAKVMEEYQLSNIRFDEYALQQNPGVWENYLKYKDLQTNLYKKDNTYSIVAWSGFGALAAGALFTSALGHTDVGTYAGPVLIIAGGIATLVGSAGMLIYDSKIKTNKKEFIYYLKAANNGIGIVTLF